MPRKKKGDYGGSVNSGRLIFSMKKFFMQFILLIIVIGIALYFGRPGGNTLNLPFLPQKTTFEKLQINGATIQVEVADTQTERNKGLSNRQNLASGSGMLFVFQKPDKYSFWMKGLSFALDFIYIRNNKVVDLLQNIQPPEKGVPDSVLPIYLPKAEIDSVLEVPAGTIKSLDILEGDSVKISK